MERNIDYKKLDEIVLLKEKLDKIQYSRNLFSKIIMVEDLNNIENLQLVFYSNYCIIVNNSTPIYYTKDFNTYTPYSGNYNYMDFNIYRSFVYMGGSNDESSGFMSSSFIQKVNDKMLSISLDDSEYYIAIGLLVKNDNMYFLTMGQNFNTFRIYKMHIPIGSKVLPNMSDTYIKVK